MICLGEMAIYDYATDQRHPNPIKYGMTASSTIETQQITSLANPSYCLGATMQCTLYENGCSTTGNAYVNDPSYIQYD